MCLRHRAVSVGTSEAGLELYTSQNAMMLCSLEGNHSLAESRLSLSGVASYGALGHVPRPSTSNNFILVHFGVNLTANYPSIV